MASLTWYSRAISAAVCRPEHTLSATMACCRRDSLGRRPRALRGLREKGGRVSIPPNGRCFGIVRRRGTRSCGLHVAAARPRSVQPFAQAAQAYAGLVEVLHPADHVGHRLPEGIQLRHDDNVTDAQPREQTVQLARLGVGIRTGLLFRDLLASSVHQRLAVCNEVGTGRWEIADQHSWALPMGAQPTVTGSRNAGDGQATCRQPRSTAAFRCSTGSILSMTSTLHTSLQNSSKKQLLSMS